MPYFLLTSICSSKFRFAPWTVALHMPKLTAGRGARIGAVTEFRIPITPALRCQVEDVVNGAQQLEAALLDVFRQRWVSGVKVPKSAVLVSSEDRHRRVLVSLAIFAAQIIYSLHKSIRWRSLPFASMFAELRLRVPAS